MVKNYLTALFTVLDFFCSLAGVIFVIHLSYKVEMVRNSDSSPYTPPRSSKRHGKARPRGNRRRCTEHPSKYFFLDCMVLSS